MINLDKELAAYILDLINDGAVNDDNIEDIHLYCFNQDHYIIGYYNASQWLNEHSIDAFEAIAIVQNYEIETFGKTTTDINSESIVNMLAYIKGEELIAELDLYDVTANEAVEILVEYLES
jgi:hypothetical protein|tara:strand:+ start:488 stop:850 length:363 start_codon:yes stop_codon:yes gene_type:complete